MTQIYITQGNAAFTNQSPVILHTDYPFGEITTLGGGIERLTLPVFSIALALVFFYIISGGYKYLTSSGDKEAVAGAQKMITHGIIGFILLMFIFLILQFISEGTGFKLPLF